ncbi:hypothetical protein HPB47_026825 [Ixodes persulcatus]|uniref:Uncharacterized protein n=1 Tax=Ixodes persulcatus TaxID=34615 RepID=A0AC60Q005_IXOPE|nr:hypothetical protein HPB47_026825 [Ixodes persulcatus]
MYFPRLCLLLLLVGAVPVCGDDLPDHFLPFVDHHTLNTLVDQIGPNNGETFPLRYAVVTRYWNPASGPIFFYCGHELTLEYYINNTGLMWNWGRGFEAMLVFSEHRFYGKSIPRGDHSYNNKTLGELLTTEQALADYVKLLHHIKIKYPFADKAPIIAIGGFYGGMLATYFRLKHPDLITGALASSAPVSMIPGMVPCHAFDYKLTQVFRHESAACEGAIRRSWPLLYSRADTKPKAIGFFQSHRVCPEQVAYGLGFFWEWMRETYIRLAMFNYKEPARRFTLLPRYPLGMCTELVTTQCSNGDADMLYVRQWNLKKIRDNCQTLYKVKPQPRKLYAEYGTRFWNSSNIIFSNGEYDPWTSLGYLSPKTETVIPILIGESAHQEDLAFGSSADRHDLIRAREQERRHVRKWIEEAERKEDTTLIFDPEMHKIDRDEF